MQGAHPLVGSESRPNRPTTAQSAAERLLIGRVAGGLILVSAVVGLVAARVLSDRHIPPGFDVAVAIGIVSGLACLLIRWDRLDPRWLNAIPILTTVELVVGIRLGGFSGDIAADYFVLIAAFAAYAFTSRWAVAGHVALASGGAALVLVYHRGSQTETGPRIAVTILLIVVIGAIITLLREALERRQRALEDMALRDPLTGVGNYRLLADRLEYELTRHRRSGHSLTVLILDLDGFKEINDTQGHLAGDHILVKVAGALRSALRSQDTLSRQGGDEFSILAPETDGTQVEQLAHRVHDALDRVFGASLTASVGWATFPEDAADSDALLNLADADLRRAKRRQLLRRAQRGSQQPSIPLGESG